MADRRQCYVVVLILLAGFVVGRLYTSSYSRLMVTRVQYLLLEFVVHRGTESGDFIVDFLKRHNLVSEISNPNHSTWTGEVTVIEQIILGITRYSDGWR